MNGGGLRPRDRDIEHKHMHFLTQFQQYNNLALTGFCHIFNTNLKER
jgi:hypothetical protein